MADVLIAEGSINIKGKTKTTRIEAAGGFENDSNITEPIVVESGKCRGLFGPVTLSNTHIKLGGNMTVIGDFSVPDTGIFKVDDGGSFEVK